jgi:glutamate dehydrogenase/leucine dehydrogenase
VFVVPDLLGNAGLVLGSYLEWVQNRQGIFFSREEVLQAVDRQLVSAFAAVAEYRQRFKADMRNAAYILAVERVVKAARMRGIYA